MKSPPTQPLLAQRHQQPPTFVPFKRTPPLQHEARPLLHQRLQQQEQQQNQCTCTEPSTMLPPPQLQQQPPQHMMPSTTDENNIFCSPPPPPPQPPSSSTTTTTTRKIRRIRFRHAVFKVGVAGLVFSNLWFIVGFSAPAWVRRCGLWMDCGFTSCVIIDVRLDPAWLNAVRCLETSALICLLTSLAVELYQDVYKFPPAPDTKTVEVLGILGGMAGVTGVVIYGWRIHEYYDAITVISRFAHVLQFNWGFALAVAGSILALLSSILIAISRVRHALSVNMALARAGVYVTPPFMSQFLPMQPMLTIPPPPGYPACPYPYTNPYSYPYPCPCPPPAGACATATTPLMACVPPEGATAMMGAQGMTTSQVPVCYVMKQGQLVPVYTEMPAELSSQAVGTEQSVASREGPVGGQLAQKL